MNEPKAISAEALFADCTYLGHDAEHKARILKTCLKQGYVATIDYDAEMGWVFHSLYQLGHGTMARKPVAAKFERRRK